MFRTLRRIVNYFASKYYNIAFKNELRPPEDIGREVAIADDVGRLVHEEVAREYTRLMREGALMYVSSGQMNVKALEDRVK